MSEKINQAVSLAAEVTREAASSPKVLVGLSAWVISVNWVDALSTAFKVGSSLLATVAIVLVIGNHWLTRKKLKMEIEELRSKKK